MPRLVFRSRDNEIMIGRPELRAAICPRMRTMAAKEKSKAKVLNFNVGVLGHVDSGKTSLGWLQALYTHLK